MSCTAPEKARLSRSLDFFASTFGSISPAKNITSVRMTVLTPTKEKPHLRVTSTVTSEAVDR